jgi:hypothetical protein
MGFNTKRIHFHSATVYPSDKAYGAFPPAIPQDTFLNSTPA